MVKNPAARNTARTQSNLARVVRNHPDDGVRADDPREVKDSDAEDYIRRLVDEAPPLSASQRDRLALLLREPDATRSRVCVRPGRAVSARLPDTVTGHS